MYWQAPRLIVSHTLNDFLENYLSTVDLKAPHPDVFLSDIMDNPALPAYRELVLNKRKPDLDEYWTAGVKWD